MPGIPQTLEVPPPVSVQTLLYNIYQALGGSSGGGGSDSSAITGEGKLWFTGTAPTGWLLCNGDAVSRTTYAALFAVIGTTFGTGDGSTTFNVPDFRGRVPAGVDGANFTSIGTTLGEENVTLTDAQVPPLDDTFSDAVVGASPVVSSVQYEPVANEGHNNIQPTLVVNFIIKT